mgnify:CR=1 FL=1
MAILFWTGDSSTHFNDDDNWSDPTLLAPANAVAPVAGDSIIFDDKSDGQNNLILVQAHITDQLSTNNLHDITVTKAFTKQIQTNGNATINLDGYLSIDMPSCIKAASNGTLTFDFNGAPSIVTYDGGGSAYAHKALVNYGPSLTSAGPSPFVDDDSRTYTTYNFGTQTFSMIDGIYPNITFTGSLYAKSVYSDASRKVFNAYGSVDILNFNGGNVLSSAFDIYDYDKQFYFEKDLTGIGEYFKFGHTTARFKTYRQIGTGAVVFPATGELKSQAFGNDTTKNFYTQYHKIVIENNDNANNYWLVNAGRFIECNELVVNDGGRFYGPSSGTKAVAIRSVKRPTVQGDWNFRQIADGIYESIGDSTNIPVSHGGTGLQTIAKGSILYGNGNGSIGVLPIGSTGETLKVSSGGIPEWV